MNDFLCSLRNTRVILTWNTAIIRYLTLIFYYHSNPRIPKKPILPPPEIEGGCQSWIQMGGTQPGVARTKAHLLSHVPVKSEHFPLTQVP